jgi:hypothetical protein
MAPEPISTVYFINSSYQTLCVSILVSSIAARQRLGKNITAAMNTYPTIEELLDGSFSMLPVSYERKYTISSSQNFLFSVNALMLGSTNKFCLLFALTL